MEGGFAWPVADPARTLICIAAALRELPFNQPDSRRLAAVHFFGHAILKIDCADLFLDLKVNAGIRDLWDA